MELPSVLKYSLLYSLIPEYDFNELDHILLTKNENSVIEKYGITLCYPTSNMKLSNSYSVIVTDSTIIIKGNISMIFTLKQLGDELFYRFINSIRGKIFRYVSTNINCAIRDYSMYIRFYKDNDYLL